MYIFYFLGLGFCLEESLIYVGWELRISGYGVCYDSWIWFWGLEFYVWDDVEGIEIVVKFCF